MYFFYCFIYQDDDGIVVRVIKSRPRDRGDRFKKERTSESSTKQTSSDVKTNKSETNRDEKRKLEREQRESKRKEDRQRFKEERGQKRQAERERNRKDREMNKKEETRPEKINMKSGTDDPNKGNQKEDRVRRYSESRRVRMENKEQNDVGKKPADTSNKSKITQSDINEKSQETAVLEPCNETKEFIKETSASTSAAKEHVDEKPNTTEDMKNNDDSSGDNAKDSSSKSLTKEERRIRNKVK